MGFPFPAYPLLNGHRFAAQSVEFTINGIRMIAVSEMNYKDSLKGGVVRGTTPYIIGTTAGIYEADGDMTMPELEWNILMSSLGPGYGERRHLIQIMMTEKNATPSKHLLVGTRIEEVSNGVKTDGADALMVKIALKPHYIVRNGFALALSRNNVALTDVAVGG